MPRASLDELEDAFDEGDGAVDMGSLDGSSDEENLLDEDMKEILADDEEDLDVRKIFF